MKKEKINLLLIGCGAVSEVLYKQAFKHIEKLGVGKLVAVMDTNIQRAKEYSAFFGANSYDNLDVALKNEKLDAVIIATPHAFHAPITIQCLNAGLGVLCEKPLAITTEECESMIATAKKVRRPLIVGFFRRYYPSTRAIKFIIDNEVLGTVKSFEFLEGEKYSWPAKTTSFFSRNISGGGILIDSGAHLIDLLLWWMGDVKHVSYSDDSMGGVEANCELKLTMSNAVSGRVRMSREYPLINQYIIHCVRGDLIYKCDVVNSIFIRDNKTGIIKEYNLQKTQNLEGLQLPFISDTSRFSLFDCFFEQLEKFCESVRGFENDFNDLNRAKRGIQLIENCYKNKKFLGMPWLSDEENDKAFQLSQLSAKSTIDSGNEPISNIKIGVIGAGGFVGYRLCEWLILKNLAKVTPIIHSAKSFSLLGRFDIKADFADLLDQRSLEKSFKGKDVIVHVAVGDDKTITKGIANTLRAAKNAEVKRIIYLSTACVYGNALVNGADEKTPLLKNQRFSYNNSKVNAEEIISRLNKELSLDIIILRPLLIWGPRSQYWITDLGEQMKHHKAFLIDNGRGICNCTFIDNLIEAIWLSTITSNCKNENFIITDSEMITWRQYYERLANINNLQLENTSISFDKLNEMLAQNQKINREIAIKKLFIGIGANIAPNWLKTNVKRMRPKLINYPESFIDEELSALQMAKNKLNCEKARKILGYRGHVSFEEGMQLTKNWIQFVSGIND